MSDAEIDKAIFSFLSSANGQWRKVAMVVVSSMDALKGDLPEGEPGYDLVAARIETLVAEGKLASQGDIKRWRHSEVCVPS